MTIIQRLNGTIYKLEDYGIRTKDVVIDSSSVRQRVEEIDGWIGLIDLGSTLDARNINCSYRLVAADSNDFGLLRDEVFKLFRSDEAFFLIEKRNPKKRWLVKVSNPFSIPQRSVFGNFEVDFVAYSGLAESVGTTLDPLTFDAEKWQVGQGLILEEPSYVHRQNSFRIFNAGDVAVDPRQFPLKIIYRGASINLKIKNQTKGDEWAYSGTSGVNDTITLDGVRSLKNDVSIFGKTNRKLLSLEPGWNDIQLSGTSGSFLISFEHRFYYL